ncbi:MAG: ABC transporter substrate-binding protein [Deltaproteobacteria bacterium]|nr:ABC transporter substrate-binding protein [Deltaproteobacteria bacterium]
MRNNARNTNRLLIVSVVLMIIAACGVNEASKPDHKIKIGILFPLSGDLADKGRDSRNAVAMAVDEVNAAGGIASFKGAKLELIVGDTQGNPDVGIRETERLIKEQNVIALIGAYQSSVTKMATQVAERLETPFIVSISIADIITERGFSYTFRIQPKAQFYARDQARFLADLGKQAGYPVKKVALIHENTDFGTATSWAQKKALGDLGLEVVAEVSYKAEGVTDLSREVARIIAAKPDAILEVTYLNDSILIRQALVKAGAKIPLIDMAGGAVSPEYIQRLGPLAEGTLTLSEYSKFIPGGKDLNSRFHQRFGVDVTGDSAHAYQSVWVLKDALERTGSVDKKKLRQALATTDMPRGPNMILPAERLRFDVTGQNEYARLFIVQIQKGELVPVWPFEYATGKLRLEQ